MQMQGFCLILIMDDHKRVMSSYMVALLYLGVPQSKQLRPHHQKHAEILAIHEASRECVWLRSIINHIHKTCGLSYQREVPTILYEDNTTCIAQLMAGYIKSDRTKHISPKFFFTHDIQERGVIDIQQVRSSDNLADIFTKALPTNKFEELVSKIGLRRLNGLKG